MASNDATRVYVGTATEGLHVFALRDGELVHRGRVPATPDYVRNLAEDASGRLWIRSFTEQRIERIERIDPDGDEVGSWCVTAYEGENAPLGHNDVLPFVWRGEVYAGDRTGIYRFVEARQRFVHDAVFEAMLGHPDLVGAPVHDARGGLWFHAGPYRNTRARVDSEGPRVPGPPDGPGADP